MHRSFKITLPGDTNYHNLYTLMLAITGAAPTDGILPDRVAELEMQADNGNGVNTVTVADGNNANTTGRALTAGDIYLKRKDRNIICLRDYYLAGSAGGESVEVEIESN